MNYSDEFISCFLQFSQPHFQLKFCLVLSKLFHKLFHRISINYQPPLINNKQSQSILERMKVIYKSIIFKWIIETKSLAKLSILSSLFWLKFLLKIIHCCLIISHWLKLMKQRLHFVSVLVQILSQSKSKSKVDRVIFEKVPDVQFSSKFYSILKKRRQIDQS